MRTVEERPKPAIRFITCPSCGGFSGAHTEDCPRSQIGTDRTPPVGYTPRAEETEPHPC